MKMHLTVGFALLLTLGTAVAGTLVYGSSGRAAVATTEAPAPAPVREPSAEMIAVWKVTAASIEFSAPRAPI